MSPTRVLGGIFTVLVVLELVGLAILTGAGAQPVAKGTGAEPPLALVAVAMAWIFGLWVILVAFMVFVIAWVAEGMSSDGQEIDVRITAHEEIPTAATQIAQPKELARAS